MFNLGYGGYGGGYGGYRMPSMYGNPYTAYQPFGSGFNLGFNFGYPGFGGIPGGMPYSYPQTYWPMFQSGGYQVPGQAPQVPGGDTSVTPQPPYQPVTSVYPQEQPAAQPASNLGMGDLARVLQVANRQGGGETGMYYASDASKRSALGDQSTIDLYNQIYGTVL